jgi:glycosyltransferase involved in cell wall biosynthesis
MRRYTDQLAVAWKEISKTTILVPTDLLSRHLTSAPARKWVAYIEKFVLFLPKLWLVQSKYERIHFVDHSDAIWLWLVPSRSARIVTCHDFIAIRAAQGDLPGRVVRRSGRVYQALVVRGLRRADILVACNSTVKADCARVTGREASHLGYAIDKELLDAVPSREMGQSDHNFLIVGPPSWRKRRDRGIVAWQHIRRTDGWESAGLTIVGPPLTPTERSLLSSEELAACHIEEGVDDRRLASLYASSAAVIVASEYEGFGWPIIEANAFGTPALCFDIPVLRETGGAANYYFTDSRYADLASTLNSLSTEGTRRRASANAQAHTQERMKLDLQRIALDTQQTSSGVRD